MKTWLLPRKNGNEGLRLKKDTPHILSSAAVATTGIPAEKHCWKKWKTYMIQLLEKNSFDILIRVSKY